MKNIFFVIALLFAVAASAQTVSSKLSFQKGQKLEVTTNMNSTLSMALGETTNSTVSTELYEVKDVAGHSVDLEKTMKKIKLSFSIMGQEKNIDSENPEDLKGMGGDLIKDLLNSKQEFTINEAGLITAVKGEAKKEKQENGMLGMFMQQANLSAAVAKEGQPSFFKILPAFEVSEGQSWTDSLNDASGTSITIYKVKGITDAEIMLDFTSDSKFERKDNMMGMSVDVKGTNKSSGTITLDKTTGILKQKVFTTVTESENNLNGQALNSSGKTNSVITVKNLQASH